MCVCDIVGLEKISLANIWRMDECIREGMQLRGDDTSLGTDDSFCSGGGEK